MTQIPSSLSGRVALVSGGSKGIGRAIVQALLQDGARVVLTARGKDALATASAALAPYGPNMLAVAADATRQEDIDRVVRQAIETFGSLDILVNNVGGAGKFAGFGELSDDDWRQAYELNVLSLVHFVRAAEQYLRQSSCGRIINISSIAGIQPGSFNPHYTVCKAATINLSKYLAGYFVKDKVLVNVVCPGPVHSDSWQENVTRLAGVRGMSAAEAWQQVEVEESAKIPLGRVGEGEDIAGLVSFLASDKASWITGSCFHVNGGKMQSI